MSEYLVAIFYTVFLWWFSTGLVLYLDGLPARTFRWSMAGASILLGAAIVGLVASSSQASVTGAYVAFTSAILVWGWIEMAYFTGVLTGPRKSPCPPDCSLWTRFHLAIGTSLYHELAIVMAGSTLLALSWQSSNKVGAWTFLLLWGMRWSTKLNVFLGVRNLNVDWLPKHLHFLQTYFSNRPMNLLFPLSVTIATVLAVLLAQEAVLAGNAFEQAGACLLAVLTVLAVLEHWFLMLPLPSEALWRWGMRSRRPMAAANAAEGPLASGDSSARPTGHCDDKRKLGDAGVPAPLPRLTG